MSNAQRRFLLVGVVAVVVLAGCMGGGGGEDDAQNLGLYGDEGATDDGAEDGDGSDGGGGADGGAGDGDTDGAVGSTDESGDGSDLDLSDVVNDSDADDGDDGSTGDNGSVEDGNETQVGDGDQAVRNLTWVDVVRPRTTETVQIEYPNGTFRDLRLAGIEAPSNDEVEPGHGFTKISDNQSALSCLDVQAEELWQYLHNQRSREYRVVADDDADGVHLVERDGAKTLNERILLLGFGQYGDSAEYVDRYQEAQSQAREDREGIWFCAPPDAEW